MVATDYDDDADDEDDTADNDVCDAADSNDDDRGDDDWGGATPPSGNPRAPYPGGQHIPCGQGWGGGADIDSPSAQLPRAAPPPAAQAPCHATRAHIKWKEQPRRTRPK